MDSKYIHESDIACENTSVSRSEKMESNFCESGILITKTTFDPLSPNGLLPRDAYYGIHCGPIREFDEEKALSVSLLCASKLTQMIKSVRSEKKSFSVLAVGIGNRYAMPDALGPLCSDKIIVTFESEVYMPKVYSISPGVLAQTGIQTSDYVHAVANEISADVIIAIDSLYSKDPTRLGAFIQIGNCGISPGAGTGKRGEGISFSSMGIPVISIGIPMVISTRDLICSAIDKAIETEFTEGLSHVLVTPKECNAVTEIGATIIARAINACLSA